ncbi:MAG: bifunctional nuclease family protein [Fimbriimonadaceae bacterium]|nr:bifunctional nuclease family protein [Fimbriimonadaceae bacterium]QYK53647.1 MAG: bifunctional nuclease family protein [Fimbriimonadaceae bacterium]
MPDEPREEPEDLDQPPAFFPYEEPTPVDDEIDYGNPVEVRVEAVFAAQAQDSIQRFVLLSDGSRKLPIVIGGFEATAISSHIGNHQPDRPMTHDLLKKVIERLGGEVKRIDIDDFLGSTYYAKILLDTGNEDMVIDARPSDAIALAVRVDAPIFVAEGILEQHGH